MDSLKSTIHTDAVVKCVEKISELIYRYLERNNLFDFPLGFYECLDLGL